MRYGLGAEELIEMGGPVRVQNLGNSPYFASKPRPGRFDVSGANLSQDAACPGNPGLMEALVFAGLGAGIVWFLLKK